MTRQKKIDKINRTIGYSLPNKTMIGDVLDWMMEEKNMTLSMSKDNFHSDNYGVDKKIGELLWLREYPRTMIEEQTDECVDFIYGLITND